MSDKKESSKITIDAVEKKLIHWRNNRKQYPGTGIPNEIWLQIFSLETAERSVHRLRAIFGLNSQQYKKKHAELIAQKTIIEKAVVKSTPLPEAPAKPITAFAEVCVENTAVPPLSPDVQATKNTIKAIKNTKVDLDTLLDTSTVIVECIRSDGHRLKIHTCSQRVDIIMQTFYSQSVSV